MAAKCCEADQYWSSTTYSPVSADVSCREAVLASRQQMLTMCVQASRTSPLGDHQLPAYYKQYDGCTLSTSRQLSPASYSSCGAAPPIGSLLLGLRDGGAQGMR